MAVEKKKIVIALGGNALGKDIEEQKEAVAKTAKVIVDLAQEGYSLIVTHGNGPQVGMIQDAMDSLRAENKNYKKVPLPTCVAMSQGYIGIDLQNAIKYELFKREIDGKVSTILSQVEVDENDEAFENTASVDKSAQKKAAVKIADAINNNLTEDMFAKQNVTVNINGEDKNVKDNTLTLSLEQFKTVFSNAISTLKLDEDFLNLYVDREQITASLDTLAESLDSISDLEGNVTIHYYTSGITNKFVGVAVVLEDAQQMEFVFELINTDKNLYESNLKVANYNGETQDILNATITINKSTNTEKDMLISVNIPQSGTIDFKTGSKITRFRKTDSIRYLTYI